MGVGVPLVDEDGVEPGQARPAGDAGNDRGVLPDLRRPFHAALEQAADDALVHEVFADGEPAPRRELRHARRGAGAARAAIDRLVAVEYGVATVRPRVA